MASIDEPANTLILVEGRMKNLGGLGVWGYGGAGWQGRALMNVLGAMSTAVVLAVFIVAKFREGAWVVVLLIPAGVSIFLMMGHHYRKQAA